MHDTILRKGAAFAAAVAMIAGGVGMNTGNTVAGETEPIALMCLGDSITDGFWMTGGYRNTLCGLITQNNQEAQVDMVGPNWGGSGYDPQHSGYSGYSVDNIAQEDSISGQRTGISSFIDWLMADYPADVVFLQIGTNDILSLYDLENYGARLEALVDKILVTLPEDGALYLATLPCMDATNTLYINEYFFTVESMDAAVEQCNTQIRSLVAKKRSEGARIMLADINAVLEKSDLYDGVHPNEEGYRKMGEFWYTQLCGYWNGAVDQGQTITTTVTTTTSTETTTTSTETTAVVTETTSVVTETTTTPSETTVISTETTVPEVTLGDVNGDGTVTVADAVALAKYITLESDSNAIVPEQADMNLDRRIDAADLSALKRHLLST